MEFNHIPIMLNEVIDNLNIKPNGIYVDLTVGGAGHSTEILRRIKMENLFALIKMKKHCQLLEIDF